MNRRSYGYLVGRLTSLLQWSPNVVRRISTIRFRHKFQPEWTAYRGSPVEARTGSLSGDRELSALSFSKKVAKTMCNPGKKAARAAILFNVCWRASCAFFLQLARFSFETRYGSGISRLLQTLVSAAVNSLTYKFTVIDIVAKTLGEVTKTSVGK